MSEQMKIEAERAAFEAWFRDKYKMPTGIAFNWEAESSQLMLEGWQARASLPVGVPDGWALVPVEPTAEIRQAIDLLCDDHRAFDDSDAFWQYLLDSAPAAPAVQAERVSVPVELAERLIDPYRREPRSIHLHNEDCDELRAILASHGRGEA